MSDFHRVGIYAEDQARVEGIDPRVVRRHLLSAQAHTRRVFDQIPGRLRIGMSEAEARKVVLETFAEGGVKKHWHQPIVRFGKGTTLSYEGPIDSDRQLRAGDPYTIDLGPVWRDDELGIEIEGDFGDTLIHGENPEAAKCAEAARQLFREVSSEWQTKDLTGKDIFGYLTLRSEEMGYRLLENVNGHRVGDFPHHRVTKANIFELGFHPSDSLWVLEVQIVHSSGEFGAFYEDLLKKIETAHE